MRERLLEAAYACVARYGIAKTTMDDVAREAKVSRATVYRHFAGGKDQLVREVVAWESARFFLRLGEAVGDATDLAELLEEALLFARKAIEEHTVLQKILQTEPGLLLPMLTGQSDRLLFLISAFLTPRVASSSLRPGVEVADAAAYLARMVLSLIASPGRWDLADRAQVRELVRTELMAGL